MPPESVSTLVSLSDRTPTITGAEIVTQLVPPRQFAEASLENYRPDPAFASQAEAVAAVDCSGHGQAFLDGVVGEDGGRPGCECNACFSGPDCSLRTPGCTADADRYAIGPSL